jgi:hypothetical protein
MFRKSLAAILILAMSSQISAQQITGQVNAAWSPDADRCVADVTGRFNAIRVRGDDLGFNLGVITRGQKTTVFGLLDGAHWQGIQRLKGGNGQYIAVSQSFDPAGRGGMGIVQMASRNASQARFRSNRLSYSTIQVTAPPAADRGVAYIQAISSATGNIYGHAGGMQAYGNYLTLPVEEKIQSGSASVNSELLFFDVTNPAAPTQLAYSIARPETKAGTSALTRLSDGRYLAMVEGSKKLHFYISNSTSLASPTTQFALTATWEQGVQGLQPGSVDNTFGNYQAYTFIVQCDGKLFMIASNNDSPFAGRVSLEDWIDLYEVTLTSGNASASLRKASNRHIYCADAAARTCNLQAGGGAYVTIDGDLSFYATEHFNDGPAASVSFSEFSAEPTSCATINDAWVEIFDDHGFADRTVFVDYADRNLRRYDNYNNLEGFNDKASSVRYCLPAGNSYILYNNNTYGGSTVTLSGTGAVGSIFDLGTIGFGDKLSSSKFVP